MSFRTKPLQMSSARATAGKAAFQAGSGLTDLVRLRPAALLLFLAALTLCGGLLALHFAGAAPAQAQGGSVPVQPTGLTVTNVSHDSVALTWGDPNDESITHYRVLRRDRDVHDTGEFVTINSDTGSAATSYTDDSVAPERRYVYRVVAVNQHGASKWSRFARANTPEVCNAVDPCTVEDPAEDALGAADLRATSMSADSITLGWAAPSGGEEALGYKIVRRQMDANGQEELVVAEENAGSAETTYTDGGLDANTQYVYWVVVIREAGLGDRSNQLPAHTGCAATGPATGTCTLVDERPGVTHVGGLSLSGVTHDAITLDWTAPSAEPPLGYVVVRRQGVEGVYEGEYEVVEGNTESRDTSYTDTGLAPQTACTYWALPLRVSGIPLITGAPSASATTAAVPSAPSASAVNACALALEGGLGPEMPGLLPPGAPVNVRLGFGGHYFYGYHLEVSWEAAASGGEPSTYMVVIYRLGADGVWAVHAWQETSPQTRFLSWPATYDNRYDAVVCGWNGSVDGDEGFGWEGWALEPVLVGQAAAATGLTASVAPEGAVELSWERPRYAAERGYRILRKRVELATSEYEELVRDTGNAATSYRDETADRGDCYSYKVQALNSYHVWSVESAPSNEVCGAAVDRPPAPLNLRFNPHYKIEANSVALEWNHPPQTAGAFTGYQILRRWIDPGLPSGGEDSFRVVAVVEEHTTSWNDPGSLPGERYAYSVRSVSGESVSEKSNEVEIRVPAQPPGAVINLSAETVDGNRVLTWSPLPGGEEAHWYLVDRCPTVDGVVQGGPGECVELSGFPRLTETTLTDTGFDPTQSYHYGVAPYNGSARGANGFGMTAYLEVFGIAGDEAELPGAPAELSAGYIAPDNVGSRSSGAGGIVPFDAANGTVVLTWTNPTGGTTATGYQVKRWIAGYNKGFPTYFICDEFDPNGACTNATKYSDSELQASVTYQYAVRLVKRVEGSDPLWSSWSETVSVEVPEDLSTSYPAAPSGFRAVGSRDEEPPHEPMVTLTWDAVDGATSYTILRGSIPETTGDDRPLKTLVSGLTETTYEDRDVASLRPQEYRVQAHNQAGAGPLSPSRAVNLYYLVGGVPDRPTGLTATFIEVDIDEGLRQVELTWTAPAGGKPAEQYVVYRAKYNAEDVRSWENPANAVIVYTHIRVIDVPTTSFTQTLETDYAYFFRIIARNDAGFSKMSNKVTVDLLGEIGTDPDAPGQPESPEGD